MKGVLSLVDFERVQSLIGAKSEEEFLNKILLPTFGSEDVAGLMTGKEINDESKKRLIELFNKIGIGVEDDATVEDLLTISYLIHRRAIKRAN